MKKILFSVLFLGLAVAAPSLVHHYSVMPSVDAAADRFMIIDVACDGRTFYQNRVDPAATTNARGDLFVVHGKMYPGETIPTGGTVANPVWSPDEPGSIGDWICRGNFMVSAADQAAGVVPHIASTQYYLFDDGNGLISEGPEGGVTTTRAVTGGIGDFPDGFMGFNGQVTEEFLGRNSTGRGNFRFTFQLQKK